MNINTLKLDNTFIGQAFYEKLGNAPRQVAGEAGQFQRHVVSNEKHGVFHIITPVLPNVFKTDDVVEISGEAIFYEDVSLNGRNVAPALNVRATGLKLVQNGGNK